MLRFLLPVLALLTLLRAQPAAPGVIEGRIVQAATGGALGNVRVSLEGSTREALTDDAGSYRLTGVPAGPVRLRASYVGFASSVETVTVLAGGVVTRDFELTLSLIYS